MFIKTVGGEDFLQLSSQELTISAGTRRACENIIIIGDNFVENSEDFNIRLTAVHENDNVSLMRADVTIVNDDGMSCNVHVIQN